MKRKSVHIHAVLEVELPQDTELRNLNLGLAGAKVMSNFNIIEDAKLATWWVENVTVCNSHYVTCPQCHRIELTSRDAVALDGKPLCILCSAAFTHGHIPQPETQP